MSLDTTYRPLDGTVFLNVDQPAGWATDVAQFYSDPNDDRWPGDLGRVLYHESVHHWQMISSGFVANLVAAEWDALLRFERGGTAGAVEPIAAAAQVKGDQPFSAKELIECWARYWDVHTRSPERLLAEEGLSPAYEGPRPDMGPGPDPYAAAEFDSFMLHGQDAASYARPYRWALDKVGGNSFFLNSVFPTLGFHAFGSKHPVAVFTLGLDLARRSERLSEVTAGLSHAINMAWLESYADVIQHAITPALRELGEPAFTAGWDVVDRGLLGHHPMWGLYANKVRMLTGHQTWLQYQDWAATMTIKLEQLSLFELTSVQAVISAAEQPWLPFMFPGQPVYRHILGDALPPPRIRFRDSDWYANGWSGQLGAFPATYAALDRRLAEFRAAQYANRRGLSKADLD